jgi:hypothetical protein
LVIFSLFVHKNRMGYTHGYFKKRQREKTAKASKLGRKQNVTTGFHKRV